MPPMLLIKPLWICTTLANVFFLLCIYNILRYNRKKESTKANINVDDIHRGTYRTEQIIWMFKRMNLNNMNFSKKLSKSVHETIKIVTLESHLCICAKRNSQAWSNVVVQGYVLNWNRNENILNKVPFQIKSNLSKWKNSQRKLWCISI